MKIAICDDNPKDRAVIKQWFSANKPEVINDNIVEFSNGEDLLTHLGDNPIDIVFLDCQMDGMDGIATTEQMRGSTGDVIVILVSNFMEYAVYGYELDVFRYVLKHDFSEKAPRIVDEALLRLGRSNKQEIIWIKTWGKSLKIYADDILYIESRRNKIHIMLKNDLSHSLYRKLDTVAEKLDGNKFIRCHKSYLVNIRYIRRMDKTALELDNGGSIPVSREMYKSAYDTLSLSVKEGL